jgi:hypothetical protein
MNPLSLILQFIGPLIIQAVETEGPAALAWLESELQTLLSKYATVTVTPVGPAANK